MLTQPLQSVQKANATIEANSVSENLFADSLFGISVLFPRIPLTTAKKHVKAEDMSSILIYSLEAADMQIILE